QLRWNACAWRQRDMNIEQASATLRDGAGCLTGCEWLQTLVDAALVQYVPKLAVAKHLDLPDLGAAIAEIVQPQLIRQVDPAVRSGESARSVGNGHQQRCEFHRRAIPGGAGRGSAAGLQQRHGSRQNERRQDASHAISM